MDIRIYSVVAIIRMQAADWFNCSNPNCCNEYDLVFTCAHCHMAGYCSGMCLSADRERHSNLLCDYLVTCRTEAGRHLVVETTLYDEDTDTSDADDDDVVGYYSKDYYENEYKYYDEYYDEYDDDSDNVIPQC